MKTGVTVQVPHLRGLAPRVIRDGKAFQRRRHDLKNCAFAQLNKVLKTDIVWIDGVLHVVTKRDLLQVVMESTPVSGVPSVTREGEDVRFHRRFY